MFGNPIAWSLALAAEPASAPTASQFGRWTAACAARPRCSARCPLSCLAEEIATPGDGQIQALVTIAGNPVISVARRGPARRGAARARVHDQRRQLPQRDDAPRARDPARAVAARAAALRRADLDVGGAQRGQLDATPIFPPPDDRPDEWEILARLGVAAAPAGSNDDIDVDALDDGCFAALLPHGKGSTPTDGHRRATTDGGPERMLDLQIRTGPVGRPLRRGARRAHARADQGRSRTASTWARWCRAPREMLVHAVGQDRARARVHHRRPPAAARRASSRDRRRRSCS